MKRFTQLLIALTAILLPQSILAADPDLTNDYTLVKSVSFGDGADFAGTEACAYTAYDTGNKKQQALTILSAPEAAAGWIALQAWANGGSGKGWWNRPDNGLYCYNAGRSACVFGSDLTLGWLVVFECTQAAKNVMTLTNAANEPDGTFSYVASEDGKKYFCTIMATENAHVGFCGNKNAGYISKISVYKPNNPVVATTYTVNYVDMDGNQLKDPTVYNAISGASISLTDVDKANIAIGDDTYVYDSDDAEGKTVANDGSTVVTVKFHKAQNFTYTVNEVCNGVAVRITTSFSYETASVTVPYRKYNALEGQLYKKDATSKEYNHTFTLDEDSKTIDLTYDAVSGTDNVVFITEGEDVDGLTPCESPNTGIRSSNSSSAFATEDTKIVTLSAGTYKLHAIIYDASKNPDSHWIFKAGETQIADFNCTTVNIQEFDSEQFTLTEPTDIIFAAAGNDNMGLDALYIVGDGQVVETTVETEVTFDFNASSHAVSSNNSTDGDITENEVLTDGDVTLSISPAEEGKTANRYWGTNKGPQLRMYSGVLKLEAGNMAITKVVINQAKWNNANTFNGEAAATSEWEGNSTNVVLAIGGNTQMNSIVVTLSARNSATTTYDDTPVGISTIEAAPQTSNAIYNIQGQRVVNATKGLYIINGKKLILK